MRHELFADDGTTIEVKPGKTTITIDLNELSNDSKIILKDPNKKLNDSNHESSKAHQLLLEEAQKDHASKHGAARKEEQQAVLRTGKENAKSAAHLPHFKIVGFDQEATQTSEGLLGDIARELKDTLFGSEKISDKIKERVVENLTPSERQKLTQENLALRNGAGMDIYQFHMFGTPMNNLVKDRASDIEEKITEKVRSSMSSTELARLDKQLNKFEHEKIAEENYKKVVQKHPANYLPMVNVMTALIAPAKPEPGAAVKNYLDRIKEESDKYLNR
jgi:hypothetical protein